ncbi:MAG: branched-chain amino acid ABC transporter permease [Alphaproteobacteria bacterium]
MNLALQYAIDALNVGGLYALMALGIGLIFGIMRLINFAHGEIVMVGAYAMWLVVDMPTPAVIAFSLVVVALVALGIERIAFRPLRGASPSTLLIASFAVAYFLQNLAVMVFGARAKPFAFAEVLSHNVEIGGLRVAVLQIVTLALTVLALGGLTLLLKRTSIGVQLRAASQDFHAARLCAVRANRVIALAFVISGVLGWIVSFVYSAQVAQLTPAMGVRPVVIGFVATILGGLGSLSGAVIGGFLVGVITVLLDATLPVELRVFKEAFLFGLVLLVLLVRPQGLIAVAALKERV